MTRRRVSDGTSLFAPCDSIIGNLGLAAFRPRSESLVQIASALRHFRDRSNERASRASVQRSSASSDTRAERAGSTGQRPRRVSIQWQGPAFHGYARTGSLGDARPCHEKPQRISRRVVLAAFSWVLPGAARLAGRCRSRFRYQPRLGRVDSRNSKLAGPHKLRLVDFA